jgi:phenylacetate-CoA ligase
MTTTHHDVPETRIAARVKDGVGVSVAVEVVDPETLERSAGKMRRVIDQRPR